MIQILMNLLMRNIYCNLKIEFYLNLICIIICIMNISCTDIEKNLKNNKIFLELSNSTVNNISYPNNESIFNNILLKNILHPFNKKNISTLPPIKDNIPTIIPSQILKFQKNTFINELINALYERALLDIPTIKDFKIYFLKFVNNNVNKEYLKTCSKSYKRLQIDINNSLNTDNIDEQLDKCSLLIKVISKVFNINILILYDNIYKKFDNDENPYLVFDKIDVMNRDKDTKIYKFREETNDIYSMVKNKNIYYSEKELNKLKLLELKEIQLKFGTTSTKKVDIINDIIDICSKFD